MERPASEKTQIWLNLGLSNSQATVYLTLSKFGQAKARNIWKVAKVARQDIYRILYELVELGIVEKVIRNPCEFRAFPLVEGVEILLERMEASKQQRISELREESAQFVREVSAATVKNPPIEESEFSIIEGDASLIRLRQVLEQSQSSVELTIPESLVLQESNYFRETFEKALRRGVKVRILLQRNSESTPQGEARKILKSRGPVGIRTISRLGLPILEIFDGREAAFVALTNLHTDLKPYDRKPSMLWTNNPSFVSTLREYFEGLWQQARIGSPTKFEALPIKDPSYFLLERGNNISDLDIRTKNLVENFRGMKSTVAGVEQPRLLLIPGKEAILSRIKKSVESAQENIDIIAPKKNLEQGIFFLVEALKDAMQRGARIRLIAELEKEPDSQLSCPPVLMENSNFKIKTMRHLSGIRFCVYDGKEISVVLYTEKEFAKSALLWSDCSSLAKTYQDHFDMLWQTNSSLIQLENENRNQKNAPINSQFLPL